jgi:hypothetical protein
MDLGHYPFWSFTMIVIDILIIYGLAGHSTEEATTILRAILRNLHVMGVR